ncbi:phage major capsid protein [Priestia megaterium]
MTIKFNKSEAMNEAKSKLAAVLTNAESTEQEQTAAFQTYFDTLQHEVANNVRKQVNDEMLDRSILQQRGQNVLTSAEMKFFNAVVQDGGFNDDAILPETTQERVFEDLVTEHPLLDALGLQDLGAVTRFIYSDPEGAAVWGPLFSGIKGQINAAFHEKQIGQLKLTAFAAIPDDMLQLGPVWVERYVRTVIVEAYAIGLESGFVNGNGNNQPVGLLKDVNAETGAVTDKASSGTLTFKPGRTTVIELKDVVKGLSKNEKGKNRKVAGKIVMVVNPFDNFDIQASATTQNANGVYVTNLPFNPQIVESEFVPEGKVIFFVKGEYIAAVAGNYQLKKFDQTLAIEDAILYTIKRFANGLPKDNKASAVYDLKIDESLEAEAPAGA